MKPRYWVPKVEVEATVSDGWKRRWLLGFERYYNAIERADFIVGIVPHAGVR